MSASTDTTDNPLLRPFNGPFGLPPFAEIETDHFRPAFDEALAEARREVQAIATATEAATFDNTILALEEAGALLRQVGTVFWNLAAADTTDEIQAIERDIAPRMAAHVSEIYTNAALFARVEAVLATASAELGAQERRLVEKFHRRFVRNGAALSDADKARHSEITARLATLGTTFSQNVLADEANYTLPLENAADTAGLPTFVLQAAEAAARERNVSAPYAITLSRSLIEPFLTYSSRRDLREKAYRAWAGRGAMGGETDNGAIIREILTLRHERAQLLGYETYAAFKLEDTMAKAPEHAQQLLEDVWGPAVQRARDEAEELAALARQEGANIDLAPWDWWYYAEKVRQAKFDLKEEDLKPYFALETMLQAAFHTAGRLFGLTFKERTDLDLYHADARAWDVQAGDGTHVGLFIGDYFARSSKRSGAWMSSFRDQDAAHRPVVINVCNFAKGGEGEPALLSLDDVHTLFHEMGHALHGLLSDVRYRSLSGTSVERDFVELPSQLFEHWVMEDEVLERFATHYETGEAMPAELVAKVHAADTFNQGFATVEYLGSALADMAFHRMGDPGDLDPATFEAAFAAKIGMPQQIGMRHRPTHFLHIFAGDGYSAGYYSYMWSEVLDADAFAAFREAGDAFDPKVAERLKTHIYSAGDKQSGEDAYLAFRGRLPKVDGLLRDRGLIDG